MLTLGAAIYTVASIIVRLTPTKKDDEVLSAIGGFFNKIVNIGKTVLLSSR